VLLDLRATRVIGEIQVFKEPLVTLVLRVFRDHRDPLVPMEPKVIGEIQVQKVLLVLLELAVPLVPYSYQTHHQMLLVPGLYRQQNQQLKVQMVTFGTKCDIIETIKI